MKPLDRQLLIHSLRNKTGKTITPSITVKHRMEKDKLEHIDGSKIRDEKVSKLTKADIDKRAKAQNKKYKNKKISLPYGD